MSIQVIDIFIERTIIFYFSYILRNNDSCFDFNTLVIISLNQ